LDQRRHEIVAWIGSDILPHEAEVRRWLARRLSGAQVDDVVQEAYCRLIALDGVSHIENGRAYFYITVRSIIAAQVRRARIVRIDSVAEMGALNIIEDEPSPERVVWARRELDRVRSLIEGLPERCRQVFVLRRVEGISQKEIARRLGISESTVESQAVRGLKLVLKAISEGEQETPMARGFERRGGNGRNRTRTR